MLSKVVLLQSSSDVELYLQLPTSVLLKAVKWSESYAQWLNHVKNQFWLFSKPFDFISDASLLILKMHCFHIH